MKKIEKDENDKKKNVVVITLIAIVTMILVVIGATFAYLANSVDTRGSANIDLSTNVSNSDLLVIEAGKDIELVANTENFGDGDGDLSAKIYSSVALQTANESESTYNYDVYLVVPTNEFDYTSGACYTKTSRNEFSNYKTCTVDNGQYYALTSDSNGEYACYNSADSRFVNNAIYSSNPTLCTSSSANMWVMKQVPEVTADIYKSTNDNETTCATATKGKCINTNTRKLVNADKNECTTTEGHTWIPNIYENGICYVLSQSHDITKLVTSGNNNYELYAGSNVETITATSSRAAINNYLTLVTLHNLSHNQIENGNKKINGSLEFKVNERTPN